MRLRYSVLWCCRCGVLGVPGRIPDVWGERKDAHIVLRLRGGINLRRHQRVGGMPCREFCPNRQLGMLEVWRRSQILGDRRGCVFSVSGRVDHFWRGGQHRPCHLRKVSCRVFLRRHKRGEPVPWYVGKRRDRGKERRKHTVLCVLCAMCCVLCAVWQGTPLLRANTGVTLLLSLLLSLLLPLLLPLAGKFSGPGSDVCTVCGEDSRYSAAGAGSCQACLKTSFTAGGTATMRETCTLCPAGSVCQGSSTVTQCAAGTLSAAGSVSCTECGDSAYSGAGASTCINCPAGSYTWGGSFKKRDACTPCPAGNECPAGTSVITPCSAGRAALANSASCAVCGDDKFSAAQATTCSSCAVGSFTSGGVLGARTACTTCQPGYACGGTSVVTACGSDSKYSTGGSGACTTCPAGSFTAGGTGETVRASCSTCAAGNACSGNSVVARCVAGKFAAAGSSVCAKCGADNKYSTGAAELCSSCLPGWFTSGGGDATTRASCNPCPSGATCDGTSNVVGSAGSLSCSDTCTAGAGGASLATNGICEDGGPGSSSSACGLGTDCGDCGFRPSTSACPPGWGYRFWSTNGKNGIYGHFCYAKDGGPTVCSPAITEDAWKGRTVEHTAPENDASLVSTYCGGASAATCKVCKVAANVPKGFYNKGTPPGNTISTVYGGRSFDLAECGEGGYNDEDWSDPLTTTSCKQCTAGFYGASGAALAEKTRGSW